MFLNIVFIILGIILVLWGADRLTGGAASVAEKLKMPQTVIGLTVVAVGTSMPEFCISVVSAVKGTPDIAVGNVVGSNIFNALLIAGVASMVAPMAILPSTVRKDIPFALAASVLLLVLCHDGALSRLDAVALLVAFAVFMVMTLRGARIRPRSCIPYTQSPSSCIPMWKAALSIVSGLVCLIIGSNVFVGGAVFVAGYLGVSQAVIGLTVVAMGTSFPELATSVVAARKGNSGIAIGNVLGSNVFNILLILGSTGVICPMRLEGMTVVDFSVMIVSMVLLWLFSFTKYTIQRWEGALLTAIFICYMAWTVLN